MPITLHLALFLRIVHVQRVSCVQRNRTHFSILSAPGIVSPLQLDSYTAVGSGSKRFANLSKSRRENNSTINCNEGAPQESTSEIDSIAFRTIMCLMVVFLIGIGVAWDCMFVSASSEASATQVANDTSLTLPVLRKSGERIAVIRAQSAWKGTELRKEVLAHLAPGEHLHSILYEVDSCERRVSDFSRLVDIDIKDGSELRVVLLSRYALPSGISLFTCSKHIPGPAGASSSAKLWIHEDRSASLECGEFIDVGLAHVSYLEGEIDEAQRLHFSNDGHDIEGDFEESHGKQCIRCRRLPILGDAELQRDLPDAVFDVSQTTTFSGWISLFSCGEMVAKLAKNVEEKAAHEVAHLRLEVCRFDRLDGLHISFERVLDFEHWHSAVQSTLRPAILRGPVGHRKLTLEGFPIIGNVELIEHPIT